MELNDNEIKKDIYKRDVNIELNKMFRRIIMFVFVILLLGIQYVLSQYSSRNNDSFGIMVSLHAIVNFIMLPVIAVGITTITLFKRDLTQDNDIWDSMIFWIFTGLVNGVIPLIEFGKIGGHYFKSSRILYELYLYLNLIISIVGSIILRFNVNKLKRLK